MSGRTYLSIGDVLALLRQEFPDVTISKIRFLESQGLVDPERTPSGYRKFYEHDVERLRWVLRQQREHFLPLKVIKGRLEQEEVEADEPNGRGTEPGAGRAQPILVGSASGRDQVSVRTPGLAGSQDGMPEGEALGANPALRPTGVASAARVAEPQARGATAPAPAGGPASGASSSTGRGATATGRGDTATGRGAPATATGARPGTSMATGGAAGAAAGLAPGGASNRAAGAGATAATGAGRAASTQSARPARTQKAPEADGDEAGVRLPTLSGTSMTAEELAGASGLDVAAVQQLESYGLLCSRVVGGVAYYEEDALVVARLAAGFARYGVEARHLRLHKHAAEREAGFIEQIVLPLLKQRNPEARQRAHEAVTDLSRLGQALREALLRSALRDQLGG